MLPFDPISGLPLALTFESFTDVDFWTGVLVLATTYTIFSLGLQMNVGYTGIFNFGQAGFMLVGAYSMAVLVTDTELSLWLALPISVLITVAFGLLIGLPSLRLRTDYFAIATIAAAEALRIFALNARELTGGAQGKFGFDSDWDSVADTIEGWIVSLGWDDPPTKLPLLIVAVLLAAGLIMLLTRMQRTPWGRVLRAVHEDEDAARALGKNAFAYKLQSLGIAATLAAISGFLLALNLKFVIPTEFLPIITFTGYAVLILGGLASYVGVAVGALILWTVLEGLRFLELPLSEVRITSLRFIILGLVLIGLTAFRPQGIFGKKEEMVLGD